MAETPFTPGTPGSPDPAAAPQPVPPAEVGGTAAPDPAAGNPSPDATAVEEASLEDGGAEEPAVEGWSGTPISVSAEEAIARPDSGPPLSGVEGGLVAEPSNDPIEISLPATPPPPEPTPVMEAPATVEPVAVAEPMAILETATESVPRPTEPAIATTLDIPPTPGSTPAEGGEFDLLIAKLRSWFDEADLAGHWQKLRGPLKGVALLLLAVLVLRLYARLVGTLDAIPVVSGLLELTGLLYLIWFSSTRLVRTSERERVLADWKRRWQDFSGPT